jgi:hypothetical protein
LWRPSKHCMCWRAKHPGTAPFVWWGPKKFEPDTSLWPPFYHKLKEGTYLGTPTNSLCPNQWNQLPSVSASVYKWQSNPQSMPVSRPIHPQGFGNKFHVNWTAAPKNCKTMSKLLHGCLNQCPQLKQCQLYRRFLVECTGKPIEM